MSLSKSSQGASADNPVDNPNDRRLLAIFLIVLIDVLGLTIILPLLPFYSEHFGASPFVVGTLVSTYAICQLISGPILGAISDRVGRKPVLIVSQIGTFVGFLVLAFATSLTWIFASRIIDGITAGNLSTAQAYITDVASPKARAQALGKIGVAFGIGFFIGPALTAFLFRYGYQAPIWAAAALSFASIMASTFLLPNKSPLQKKSATGSKFQISSFTKYFKNPVVGPLLLQIFLFYLAFSAYMSGFALFAERRFTVDGVALTAKQIGYAYTYFGFLGIIIQGFLIGRLVARWGERRLALTGFIASAIGYAGLSFIHGPLWIALTGLATSFGSGVLRPALTSEIAGQAEPHERGTVMGVNQGLMSIAQILAPLISTSLIGFGLLPYWAWLPAALSLLGAGLVLLLKKTKPGAQS